MPIDPKSVQWDSPAPAAKGIDPSTVQWDSAPEPSKVGAELPGVFDPATYMDAAKQAYSAAVKNASPAMLANPDFGSMVAHGVAERYGVPVSALIAPPDNAPASYKEGGPAAAAGAFMQGFAKPLAQAAAVPVGLAGGLAGRDAQDALFKTYDRMNAGGAGEADIARSPTAGGLGTLGGSLAGFALAPEAVGAEALPLVGKLAQGGKAAKTLGAALEHALTQAPGALAAGGLPQGSVAAAKTLQDGGTLPQAFGEAATGAALGTTQFLAPVSLEGNLAVRAASGMGIQQAMSQAQQQAQHAIAPNSFAPAKAPDFTDPMTYLGAVLGAVGGRGEVRPLDDPMLGQLKDAAGAPPLRPTGPLQLPAPEIAPPAPAAAKPAAPLDPAAAFLADPKAALSALDPVVLHQVAGDAGFNVRPGTAPSTIIDTMLAKGAPFLHSDVLPEYLAALQEHGIPAAASAAPASEAPGTAPAPTPPQDIAQALQAGATVPVDSAGTAYTPQQGIASLSDALAKRAVGGEQLPAPVTTVDRHGNAMTSADFLAKTKAAQAEAEQQQNAVLNRQHLGITPDIERTQGPRWRDTAAKSDEIANRLANEPDDEIVSQRTDDSPPWWLAGQHAADEAAINAQAAPNAQKLQQAIATGPANAPMHPWTPVVTDKSIPYAGGQSKDLSTAFIDKRIPQMMQIAGKNIDVHQAIGLHENIESSLIRNTKSWSPAELDALAQKVGLQSGADFPKQVREKLAKGEALSYVQGHNIATKGENHFVAMTYGIPAAKYQMALKPAIAAALKQGTGASDIPATLDSKPYDNMGETHLLGQQQDAAYQQYLMELSGERQAMSGDDRARATKVLNEMGVPPADHDEMIALIQLADRAYNAGADARDIVHATQGLTPSEQGRALYDLATKKENPRAEPESGAPRDQAGDGSSPEGLPRAGAAEPEASAQAAPAEQAGRVPAKADQVKGDLFAPATIKDRLRAANQAKDATRNGLTGGREDTGDGGLFDGKRPEQVSLDDAEVTEHSLSDSSPEAREAMQALQRDRQSRDAREAESSLTENARQESIDQGERDATSMGLRDVVSKALEGLGGHLKVEFVRDETGLPEGSNLRPLPKGMRRFGTFMPSTGRVFIFTGSRPSMAEAAFTAAHEVYGHRAMRLLAEAHPDVKVGTLTAPEALNQALDMALQNPTVAKVAESMSKQRGSTDRRLMAEEAMADLSAAKQTGNWDKIKTKHGVDVPEGMRNGVKGAIANFIERMRRLLNAIMAKITGKPADFTDAQVHEFMQDAADQLHGDEAAPSKDGGQALDAVDHEAVSQTHLSIPMVKEALRNRGVSEDVIAGMSRAELRAEQSALRARSEPTPEQADTGVKNATKEEERVMKGKAAVEHDLSTSNPAQYATAKARFDADPHAGQILAAKVISEKKSITPEESILLSLDAMRIINARQSAYEQAEQAMGRGDEATRTAALSLVRQLDGQMEANDIAARYSGVRAGQALQARKVMIAQDYSMARLVLRAKVAKGEALTDAERVKVEKAADAIAQRTKELDAREAKLRAMEAEARPVAQKRAAKAKFDDLVAELKAIAQKDHMNPGCVV